MPDDLEVVVGDDTITVTVATEDLVVTVDQDNDFEILQDPTDDFEITLQTVASTALTIALYARFSIFIGSAPSASELLFRHEFTDQVTFAEDFALSRASAVTGATGTMEFSIQKNDVEVATVTFTSNDTGVYAGSATTFDTGDILSLVAPASEDATLAGISFTLAGVRVI